MTDNPKMLSSPQVTPTISARIPTGVGEFQLHHYTNTADDKEHLALVMGHVAGQENVLTRVHSECLTGDIFGSRRCDCGEQLQRSMQLMADEGRGILIYLRQEGRGIGLEAKLTAYNLQDEGYDTVEANLLLGHQADEREYWAAARILADLQVSSIRLLTNNPAKLEHLTELGVLVNQRVPLAASVNEENAFYLNTKVQRMRHMLDLPAILPHNAAVDQSVDQPGQNAISAAARERIERLRARAHAHYARTGLPFVTVSYAQSLDGSITASPGKPFAISGTQSLILTHALRAAHDGVLIGVETLLADDPRLDVRLVKGPNPEAIIVDSRLRTPANARIFDHHKRTWLATTTNAAPAEDAYTPQGGRLIMTNQDEDGRVDLKTLLAELGRAGMCSIMVEGGAAVLSSFLRQGLADYAVVTVSPLLLGGLHAMQDIGAGEPPSFPHLTGVMRTEAGDDLILWGALDYPWRNDGRPIIPSPSQPPDLP